MRYVLFILCFLPLNLLAQSYTFSTGEGNVALFVASQVIKKAYAKSNTNISIQFMNLQESLNRSNAGITDGEVGRIKNITRLYPNLVIVPVSVGYVEAVAFSKNTQLKINKWEDLRGHDFTVVKGAKFIEIATKNMPRNLTSSFVKALNLLKNDHTEIVVLPKLAGLEILLNSGYKDIKMISPTLKKLRLYHFVHTKNTHLIPIITPYLKAMEKSGEIAYMRERRLRNLVGQ